MACVDTSYYDYLEVAPNATQDEIKRAYRNMAKTLHPDMGGDAEEFAKLSKIYEVLCDPELRKAYDKFGPIDKDVERYADLRGVQTLTAMLQKIATLPEKLLEATDIREAVFSMLQTEKVSVMQRMQEISQVRQKATKMLSRWRKKAGLKEGKESVDFVGGWIRSQIASMEASIGMCEQQLDDIDQARAILETYDYQFDPAVKPEASQSYASGGVISQETVEKLINSIRGK